MTTEITAITGTSVPSALVDMGEWGDVQVSSKDVTISKVLLMQGTSALVSDGKAKVGDVLLNSSGEVVADYEKKLKLLPFLCKKEYVVSIKKDGQWKFDHTEEVKGEFTKAYEETRYGSDFKNEEQYSFYCLLEDGGMPVVISFKGKSVKTGRSLFTQMYVQNQVQTPPRVPAHNWITVNSKKEKNDKGPYAVWTVNLDAVSSKEDRDTCLTWIRTINTQVVKIHEDAANETSDAAFASDATAIF